MKKNQIIIAVVLIAVFVGGIFYFKDKEQTKDDDVIRVGAIVFLTGESASLATPLQNGLLLAVKYINSNGGVDGKKVELIIEDSKSSAKGTVDAYKKLMSQNVSAIITTGDIEFRAINSSIEQNPIPIIATASTGGIENRSKWVFRYCYSEESQDRDLSEFLINDMKLRRLAVAYPNNLYGADILKYTKYFFEKLGGEVVAHQSFETSGSFNSRATALHLINSNPEVIYVRGIGSNFESIIRQLRENGYKGQITGDVTIGLPSTIENLNEIVEKVYYVASELDVNSTDELIQNYVQRYRTDYNSEPNFWDALGFDSFYFLAEALKRGSESKESLRESLLSMGKRKGLLGEHQFNESGDLEFKTSIFTIENGKPTIFKK